MKIFYRMLLVVGLVFLGLNCTKTFTLPPSAANATPTPGSNPSNCTSTPTPGPPPNGIYWYSAQVEGITVNNGVTMVNEIFADVLLSVNGASEATAAAILNGPGFTAPMNYTGNTVQNGNTYAQYQSLIPTSYQPGSNYSLSTNTSLGMASGILAGPGNISLAPDGSSASWSNPGLQNTLMIQIGGLLHAATTIYQTAACANETSPVNIPALDYSFTDQTIYTVTAHCQNSAAALTGGTGNFKAYQNEILMLNKNATPTPTAASCGGGGPNCTPSPTPMPDTFMISSPSFQPAVSPVSISVSYPNYPGNYYLAVFNDSGTHIKTLDAVNLSAPLSRNYNWDGTDKYGNPVPDGVYVLSLQEPFDWKLQLVLLIR